VQRDQRLSLITDDFNYVAGTLKLIASPSKMPESTAYRPYLAEDVGELPSVTLLDDKAFVLDC
jgi:hypothetical protein